MKLITLGNIMEYIHKNHRQRLKNKFLKNGLSSLEPHEIIELTLFNTIPRIDVNPLAHKLISQFGSLKGVFDAGYDALLHVDGVGEATASYFQFIKELIPVYNRARFSGTKFNNSKISKPFCQTIYEDFTIERFAVLCLDANDKMRAFKHLGLGSRFGVQVEIRDITAFAIANKCSKIIITHSHTTNNCVPSNEDITFTRSIYLSCLLNDIDVTDHIIVTQDEALSFTEVGLMQTVKQLVLKDVAKMHSPKNGETPKVDTVASTYAKSE